jgi:flagellar hook-associated protein 1
MTGLTQLINIGSTGLEAASQALETISNNTANVNTPGYNVESVQQQQLPGFLDGAGHGVSVTSIQRAFDRFAFSQLVSAGSASQAAQVAQNNAQTLSAMFPVASGGAGGLNAAVDSFFTAMNTVSQDPTSLANRQVFLANAQSLAADFNSLGSQLAATGTALNGQLTSAVNQINTLTQQIATLNAQIMARSAPGIGGPPNALLDTRDSLIQQLGQQLGITVVAGPSNTVSIFAGGAALVTGATASSLAATPGTYGGSNLDIVYQPTGQDITNSLSGGTIGGLMGSQSQLVAAQNSVGGMAVSLAQAVNTQQSLGLDLNGALGSGLFSVGGPSVLAASTNTGSGTLTAAITNTNAFTPGNFIVANTASGFQATNTATGQVTNLGSGPSLALDGMILTVSGTVNIGDSFEVEPTATAAQTLKMVTADPNAVAAASVYVATPGGNIGNVTASAFSPARSGSLPAGTAFVPAANFGQNLTVKFTSATTYNVLSSSNAVIASGSFSAGSGAQIAIRYPGSAPAGEVAVVTLSPGTPAAGDSFVLTPGGIGSNGNILAMTGLSSQNLIAGQTLNNAYAGLVGRISAGQTATIAVQTAQGVLSQVTAVQQSISGVNLDEQAANLVQFQQAYQAAAQVIASAQILFQNLLAAVAA